MLVTCDDGLRQYLGQVLTQLSGDLPLPGFRGGSALPPVALANPP
jgi:hypothetical protein